MPGSADANAKSFDLEASAPLILQFPVVIGTSWLLRTQRGWHELDSEGNLLPHHGLAERRILGRHRWRRKWPLGMRGGMTYRISTWRHHSYQKIYAELHFPLVTFSSRFKEDTFLTFTNF